MLPYLPLAGLIRYYCMTDSDTEAQIFRFWRRADYLYGSFLLFGINSGRPLMYSKIFLFQ